MDEKSKSAVESIPGKCRGVAQPGSAPALGARYVILSIPFPALVSILFNKLGNLLLVQSYLQLPQPRSQMHGSGTAAHLLVRLLIYAEQSALELEVRQVS